jgi:hypothetical protein
MLLNALSGLIYNIINLEFPPLNSINHNLNKLSFIINEDIVRSVK